MAKNRVFANGRQLTVTVAHPSGAKSGDPVRLGGTASMYLCGVALEDADASEVTTVDFEGVYDMVVDDDLGTGVVVGSPIYFHDTATGTPATHLNNKITSADGLFGIALEALGGNATGTIRVKLAGFAGIAADANAT